MPELLVRQSNGDLRSTYWSLDEYASEAERLSHESYFAFRLHDDDSWAGGTLTDALNLAREGWQDKMPETLAIAESAVTSVFRVAEMDSWLPVHDVAGCDVDIARYLAGEPECMIEYPLQRVSKAGKVITLCASIGLSSRYSAEELVRRGQIVTALALALEQLGHNTELWVDWTSQAGGRTHGHRILVKGANDVIDPARILYAYAHPSMLRRLCFANAHNLTARDRDHFGVSNHGGYGRPHDPYQDLPDGTIYMPSTLWIGTNNDPAAEITAKLRELELIES